MFCCERLAGLRDQPWRLTLVGGLDRDPPTLARIRELGQRSCGLEDRVRLAGEAEGRRARGALPGGGRLRAGDVARRLRHGRRRGARARPARGQHPNRRHSRILVEPSGFPPAGLLVEPGDKAALRRRARHESWRTGS